MNKPKFTWFILEDIDGLYQYSAKRTHDMEGSYAPGDSIIVKIQLWNNRRGTEDVADAENARLVLYFKNYEDNYLLKLFKINFENETKPITIDMDRGIFNLRTISGSANNGNELNVDNYLEFELQIGPIPSNVKSELKGLVLDVEYDS